MKLEIQIGMFAKISFQILAIFTVIFFASFLPDYYPSFFGDWYCDGHITNIYGGQYIGNCQNGMGQHNPQWHWGYRHWVYFGMGLSLFFVQIFRIVNLIEPFKK